MGVLKRFQDRRAERAQQRAEHEAAEKARREVAAREEAARRRRVEEDAQIATRAAEKARLREILGPELFDMDVETPAQAKVAIKLLRLRKRELQAKKRDLGSDLADVREQWRERTAGRISTTGMGRGTGAKIIRAGVQGKRRAERQQHANQVNRFSDAKQEIDAEIAVVDRVLMEVERKAIAPTSDA